MFCKYCGKQIGENSKFCSYCGKNLTSSSQTVKPSVQSPPKTTSFPNSSSSLPTTKAQTSATQEDVPPLTKKHLFIKNEPVKIFRKIALCCLPGAIIVIVFLCFIPWGSISDNNFITGEHFDCTLSLYDLIGSSEDIDYQELTENATYINFPKVFNWTMAFCYTEIVILVLLIFSLFINRKYTYFLGTILSGLAFLYSGYFCYTVYTLNEKLGSAIQISLNFGSIGTAIVSLAMLLSLSFECDKYLKTYK